MKTPVRRFCLPLVDYIAAGILLLVTLLLTWLVISSPQFMLTGTIVTSVQTNEKVVALTFDDGPLPVHAGETLEVLKKSNVTATFFVIGREASAHESELRAIVAAGHAVGNHGYSHTMMAFLPPSQIAREIEATDAVIRAAGYTGDISFRAPYNIKFWFLPRYLATNSRPDISRDVLVAEGTSRTTEAIVADVVSRVQPGSIILLHPMYDHTASTREAIPRIVEALTQKSYRFVTIDELLELGN